MIILRFAICEDDPGTQQRLSDMTTDWAKSRNLHVDILSYPNAEAFLMAWPDIAFDFAFLDRISSTLEIWF